MMFVGSTVCVSTPADAAPHAKQAVGRIGQQPAVVRNTAREDVLDWNLEGNREDVETGEDVFNGPAARAGDAAKVGLTQVDKVENPLFIQLIRIVELAGDDPPAVRQRVDEGVHERLIVETGLAAGGIAAVVPLERTEAVNEPVSLRSVVVRQNGEIAPEGDGFVIVAVVVTVLVALVAVLALVV